MPKRVNIKMSLFPAYSKEFNITNNNGEVFPKDTSNSSQWLENNSFLIKQQGHLKEIQQSITNTGVVDVQSNSQSSSVSLNDSLHSEHQISEINIKKHKKSKKKKKKKDKECSKERTNNFCTNLEFTGEEAFYVDKSKAQTYTNITTLHRPACPKYKKYIFKSLGQKTNHNMDYGFPSIQRYFNSKILKDDALQKENCVLEEREYTTLLGSLNRKTVESPKEIEPWIEIVQLQDKNPYKWSRLKISEKKIDYIQKALQYNPRNKKLYRLYIEIITATYPSHDITKMLENLLNKDPYCFILWQAQIMNVQGTMASCTIPKVLALYQRCMRKMYTSQKEETYTTSKLHIKDTIILRLFHNCCLFLRQAGLYEQFFALIKLALELNITNSENIYTDLIPRPEDEKTLIEYEEVVLQSGLPMNEIWLRIEKLRQSFNFLPIPMNNGKNSSDPQRIVFNEDICHYVYPLKSKENTYRLILIIIKLLKIPFIGTHCLYKQFEGDTDAIEELLIFCLSCNYIIVPSFLNHELSTSIYELVKELYVSPTYLNHNIAHELYTHCLRNFLINCAMTYYHDENDKYDYDKDDEKKRLSLLLLWCRFEHLLLIIENLSNKVTVEYIKNGQSRFKSMLKKKENRNILYLYVEFALYEIEAKSQRANIENIFINILKNYDIVENTENLGNLNAELLYVFVTYAEILIGWQEMSRASQLLSAYALNIQIFRNDNDCNTIKDVRKLLALKQLEVKLENVFRIEENVDSMNLEQYLLPDATLLLLKTYVLLKITLQQKQQAIHYLEELLLRKFRKDTQNVRHMFLREQIYELYINILQLPNDSSNCNFNKTHHVEKVVARAMQEYPRNIHFIYQWGNQSITMVWYKVQSELLHSKNPSILTVMFIIALIRYRYMKLIIPSSQAINDRQLKGLNVNSNIEIQENMVRHLILNLFKMLLKQYATTSNNSDLPLNITLSLQRNSLFWRCYLRCLSDQKTSFDTSRKCLLTALDECPWSKALYMDGVMYVPQEISHLQDLIIEKQLRIYALPEELEILREH